MRGLAHRAVVHAEVAADRPHHDLAGIQPDPDVNGDAVGSPHALGVLFHGLLHGEGGVACAHRVVFVRDRRAEERHDAVAHHLVDRAFVPVDGAHHQLEHRIEQPPRFFGIAVGEQLHRAFQIGEKHGDLLALAFERGLRGQDALGEVLRRVGGGCRRGGRRLRRLSAGGAESRLWRERFLAVRAGTRQRSAALLAKFRVALVLGAADGANHAGEVYFHLAPAWFMLSACQIRNDIPKTERPLRTGTAGIAPPTVWSTSSSWWPGIPKGWRCAT